MAGSIRNRNVVATLAVALVAALSGSGLAHGPAQAHDGAGDPALDVLEITGGGPPTTFVDGTDFREMAGSVAVDVTAPLYSVDLTVPPFSHSGTSGCEASDFAGFPLGSIALIQRGTCTFSSKAANATAAGAAAVIVFNEGQAGRTDVFSGNAHDVSGSGQHAAIAIVAASYAVGIELHNGVTNGTTGLIVHLATDGIVMNAPPELQLPTDIVVNATSPSGAVVTYTATASDPDGAVAPTVECAPASGSTFLIGATSVDCVATDDRGDTDTGSFLVQVRGPAEQAQTLLDEIQASDMPSGTKSSLTAKLDAVRDAATRGNTTAACNGLQSFRREVVAQTPRIGAATASHLLEQADALAAALGC